MGGSTCRCPDKLYWEGRMAARFPGYRVRVLPLGGKSSVMNAFSQVSGDDTKKVFYGVDLDYDHIVGQCISDPRVMYTEGYSFENDLLVEKVFRRLFQRLYPLHYDEAADRFISEVMCGLDVMEPVLRRLVKIDYGLLVAGRKGLLDESLAGALSVSAGQFSISASQVLRSKRELLRQRRKVCLLDVVELGGIAGARGHAVFSAAYMIVVGVLRWMGLDGVRVKKDDLKSLMAAEYCNWGFGNNQPG
ncbi:DUF4435 domain-containing protein [Thioalkalivibrio sp. AKL7]|uniref:DUF4435 domain-containing protein n=1 Tax=Thioalkalivibrio sp. AKL7 TaxID=1158155 RepID=UPI002101C7FE|nr:DUF4435 domain-containing protein [Thioalkalivibrio sp. AKL7]